MMGEIVSRMTAFEQIPFLTALKMQAEPPKYQHNHTSWFLPQDYNNHYEYLRSEWTAVFTLLVVWILVSLACNERELISRPCS